ncbi:phosphate/phosphite/phosphonate ABC transporter substrate-binding protein [Halalkalibacter sp. APA_J-10(15)]|uniref:phosphate/phosphite/phosphonate ABC transporter substrate-binding protein n=1 Tax=Halalkalibacter sp. APA_J-10(15) TaxID=2933805 RepID=UPI001FF2C27A|nr:PhnD/SsuA/transferrin family substrate-binding protein [Halalkalibacter sp. APA_J-10(15)]MCK0471823.1 PhnD/SsuA/transferrin family substrate-binding protein [Halalkalibacter sp. APA_J-10(15)]
MLKKPWLAIIVILITSLVACGTNDESGEEERNNEGEGSTIIDTLSIGFVPSRDPDEIITATEPLKDLLTDQLAELGYEVSDVDITVGTNYEAVGEGLSAGTIDVGLIPGGTYVLYDDGAEVILTATRAGLNNDSDDASEWNANKPTEPVEDQVTYYRALIIAGPSDKGQELADKVNNGEELTFDDVNHASWAVMSSSSPAGYIYPALWLREHYDQTITDLDQVVQSDSYGNAFARLAAGQIDVLVTYADARRDNEDAWTTEFGRSDSIWDETNVIGVTPGIYNDTISVSRHSDSMDDDLKAALQQAFINMAETEEGKEVISIYNHEGYQEAKSADYDNEREAQQLVQSLN